LKQQVNESFGGGSHSRPGKSSLGEERLPQAVFGAKQMGLLIFPSDLGESLGTTSSPYFVCKQRPAQFNIKPGRF
jgi:hypothetical protein